MVFKDRTIGSIGPERRGNKQGEPFYYPNTIWRQPNDLTELRRLSSEMQSQGSQNLQGRVQNHAERQRLLGSVGGFPLDLQLHVHKLNVDGKRNTPEMSPQNNSESQTGLRIAQMPRETGETSQYMIYSAEYLKQYCLSCGEKIRIKGC